MRFVCIAEHYLPRVGGTASYVHETCAALAAAGAEVELVVPRGNVPPADEEAAAFGVTRLDAGYSVTEDPARGSRNAFCRMAGEHVLRRLREGQVDVVWVLFGLYLMEALDTGALRAAGVATVATVHNVPPMECRRAWPGSPLADRAKDAARAIATTLRNRVRLRRHAFDLYVTPSDQVGEALARVLPKASRVTIAHGIRSVALPAARPPRKRRPSVGEPLRLLTVGGWVPHKRQHLVPAAAAMLEASGVDFRWVLAGPPRIPAYRNAVEAGAASGGLSGRVVVFGSLSGSALDREYEAAHLYVQPSTEEGFCLAALDAAALGLPVIGSPAGALPDLSRESGGRLVDSDPGEIARAILGFVAEDGWSGIPDSMPDEIRRRYTWARAVEDLLDALGAERAHGSTSAHRAAGPRGNGRIPSAPVGGRSSVGFR